MGDQLNQAAREHLTELATALKTAAYIEKDYGRKYELNKPNALHSHITSILHIIDPLGVIIKVCHTLGACSRLI